MKVIKKDGTLQEFDANKIKDACLKAAYNNSSNLTEEELNSVVERVKSKLKFPATVENIHKEVILALKAVHSGVAAAYKNYHNYRKETMNKLFDIFKQTKAMEYAGDRENANYDTALFSTRASVFRGYNSALVSRNFYLTRKERELMDKGYLYFHDLKDIMFGSFNCCLFDCEEILKGGFTILNTPTKEPKRVASACGALFDIINAGSSQQYGGFTVCEVDRLLAKYAIKEFNDTKSFSGVMENIKQGIQSLQHHINSTVSSRGDVPFLTFTFGNYEKEDEKYGMYFHDFQKEICIQLLDYRCKHEMAFPKLVYLYKKSDVEGPFKEVFDKAIECNSKTLYPDYISLDAGYTGEVYKRSGKALSCMGCRSFLSPYKDENGEEYYVGRANVGVVSLNLPMIYMGYEDFYEGLDTCLSTIREFFKRRYEQISKCKCSSNPLAYCEGGIRGGHKQPNDEVGDLVKSFTASFGVTALNELNILMSGKGLHEGKQVVEKVVDYINNKIEEFKKEDGYLYSLYGTPAESLCGVQAKQFKEAFGEIAGVSDKGYFNNSFHCDVTADIDPIRKQDLEYNLFHKFNGGHIQYVRIDEPANLDAIRAIIKRGMEMGFYQGVNVNCISCSSCEEHFRRCPELCPHCGSDNIVEVGRVCGYKGEVSRRGNTRMNDAKREEFLARKCM